MIYPLPQIHMRRIPYKIDIVNTALHHTHMLTDHSQVQNIKR